MSVPPPLAALNQNWQINDLAMRDGLPLRTAFWKVAAPAQGYVLMLPGLGEFIEKRSLRAAEWATRGYQALTFDWRYQGGSGRALPDEPLKCHIDSFDTYLDDLKEVWNRLWLPHVGNKFSLLDGHSTGSHLALRFLARAQPQHGADLLIALSPLVDIKTPSFLPPPLARMIIALAGAATPTRYALGQPDKRSFETNYITSDRDSYEWWSALKAARPEFVTEGVTWGWVAAQMRSSIALKAELPAIKTPTLALLTTEDPHTNGKSQLWLQQKLPHCTAIDFPDSMHEIYMERPSIRERAWAAIDQHLFTYKQSLPPLRRKELGL